MRRKETRLTHDLRIERFIDATPSVVFDAFVDPKTQPSLYDNQEDPDWHVESEIDLRVGGTWIVTFGRSGETAFRETNVFTEVDRPHRLVFDSNMFGGPYGTTFDTKVTVTFEAHDGKTILTIVQRGFEKRADRDMIESGWPGILDALEGVVARQTEPGIVMTKPETVDEYIDVAPDEARDKLREIRAILKQAAPNAEEKLKWGAPVLEGTRILFSYSAHKTHLNFMPTRSSLEPFHEELAGYKTGRDTIQLPYDQALPRELIEKIAAYRVKEVAEEDSLWMHRD